MWPSYRYSRVFLIVGMVLAVNILLLSFRRNYPQSPHPLKNDSCHVAHWNRVETQSISTSIRSKFSRWLWMTLSLSDEHNQPYTPLSIMGAYVYPDHISVSISAQYMAKQRVYCRYYDCKKTEIPDATWQSVVFPESVVHCPRRKGAEFVSVSKEKQDEAPTPVKLSFRVFQEPAHELAVCVAPLFGSEPKWLQIAEFVEHHKLEGATYFYFSVGTIAEYDRQILDYYENLGEVDVKVLADKYERPYYAWHNFQLQDCHLRSKYHSKWTAFIDIDERIATVNRPFIDLLRITDNGLIAEIQLPILNLIKDQDAPERYQSAYHLKNDLEFEKFISSADPTWNASKALIRSDKVGIMSTHYAIAKESGFKTVSLDSSQAVVRHYRSTQRRSSGKNWHQIPQADGQLLKFTNRPLDSEFAGKLAENILKTVENVYGKVAANCSAIPRDLWEPRGFPDPCETMLFTW